MKKVQKELSSGVHALIWKEGTWFVARCVEVELASQGKTRNEALKNIEEALSLYFDEKTTKIPTYSDIKLHALPCQYA